MGTGGGVADFRNNSLAIYTDDAAASRISVPITNFRNNANNTLSLSFVKYGPGTLELSGANTFQANVQVNQGTLSLTAANVMPNFANLNAVSGSTVTIQPGANVLLNGNDQEFGNLAGSSVVSAVQNTAGTLDLGDATLVLGRQGSSTTCLLFALALFQSLIAASTASRASGMSDGEAIMTRSTQPEKLMP